MLELVAGRVQSGAAVLSGAMPLIKSGKVRAIGLMTGRRSKLLPELPTIAEQGLDGFNYAGWVGLVSPRGTSSSIIQRLNEEFVKVARAPEVMAALEKDGGSAVGSTAEQFGRVIAEEVVIWKRVVSEAGIVLEK